MRSLCVAAVLWIAFAAEPVLAAGASLEQKLEILQQELDELKAEIAKLKGQSAQQADAQPQTARASAAGTGISPAGAYGNEAAIAAAPGSTTLGGYGELVYNNFRAGDSNDQIDFRRFVLFLGHKFSDRLRLYSELEVEHALVEGGQGALELEQAFLDYRVNDAVSVKVGAFLVPLGILNETHEPPTFFGVERNEVETRIIPATWRESGIGVHGEIIQGLQYDTGIVSSLDAGKFAAPENGIREMRTELREAAAHDFALYGALNYRGIPGLLAGAGVFSGNTGQNGASDPALKGVKAPMTLWDVHTRYRRGGLDLQALYARGSLGDADQIAAAASARESVPVIAPKSFYGWYAQAGYHFAIGEMEIAPFVRYERYNTQASVPSGFSADLLNNERVTTLGIHFKPHPQVVLKADFQDFQQDHGKDRFNLGVGYMF